MDRVKIKIKWPGRCFYKWRMRILLLLNLNSDLRKCKNLMPKRKINKGLCTILSLTLTYRLTILSIHLCNSRIQIMQARWLLAKPLEWKYQFKLRHQTIRNTNLSKIKNWYRKLLNWQSSLLSGLITLKMRNRDSQLLTKLLMKSYLLKTHP